MKTSSANINDNTGIMSHLSNHSNEDNATVVTTDVDVTSVDNTETAPTSINNASIPTITVTQPQSTSTPTTLTLANDSFKEVADSLGDAYASDFSDLEPLTQADRRDVGPGTRTDVSPLMKMELAKQRVSLRRSSPYRSPASKRMCPSKDHQQQQGRCETRC